MQEDDPKFLKFVSTAKHFSLYDFENGTDASGVYYIRNNFTAVASRKMAVQYYWPPFLSATQRGGVMSIMCSCACARARALHSDCARAQPPLRLLTPLPPPHTRHAPQTTPSAWTATPQ